LADGREEPDRPGLTREVIPVGKKPQPPSRRPPFDPASRADSELLEHLLLGTLNSGVFFELCVLKLVEHLSKAGGLGFQPEATQVFYRKRYPSNSGEGTFQADISVEVYRPSKREPMLILIWECKNHSRRVGRAGVQKFLSDIHEIGASRVKGIVATPHGLTRWAKGLARKHGIGVWQIQMPERWESMDVGQLECSSSSESLESFDPIGGPIGAGLAVGVALIRSIIGSVTRYRGPYY
jgi:hypothetical protein